MGIFKGIKDLKNMTSEAPGLLAQTSALTANARAMAEQQSAVAARAGFVGSTGAEFAMIAGVSLEQYVTISQRSAAVGHDATETQKIADTEGITGPNWATAVAGWNARMQSNPTVAQRFNSLYTAG